MTEPHKRRRGHGDPAPYQRASDGRWVGTVWLPNPGGKPIRKYVYGATQKEAQKKRDVLKASVASGVLPDSVTLGAWLDHWLNLVAVVDRKATTIDRHRSYVEVWIKPTIGAVRLQDLQVDHVRLLLATMKREGSRRKGKLGAPLSPRTILKAQLVLQAALSTAVSDGRILRNVAKLAESGKLKEEPKLRKLTPDEAARIIDCCDDVRNRARLGVALMAGLRQGEALALRWECVALAPDGSGGVLDIPKAATYVRKQGMVEDSPKTIRSVRLVPIGPACAQLLLAWREASGGKGYVFHGFTGPDVVEGSRRDYEVWKRALEVAGVPHARLHAARGAAESHMAGVVPMWVAAEIMGHSENVAGRYYSRATPQQRLEAANAANLSTNLESATTTQPKE